MTRDGRWLVLRRSFGETGDGDIYAVRPGDTTLVAAAHDAGHGDQSGGVARRPVAGVRVATSRDSPRSTCGRSPTWRRRGGRCRPAAERSGVGPQRARAVLPQRQPGDDQHSVTPGAGFAVGQPRVLFPAAQYSSPGMPGPTTCRPTTSGSSWSGPRRAAGYRAGGGAELVRGAAGAGRKVGEGCGFAASSAGTSPTSPAPARSCPVPPRRIPRADTT